MGEATLLVGMSVREVDARAGLVSLADEVGAGVAFLQLGDPSLSRELDRLADSGVARVMLVGVSLGTLAPAASWLRRVAAHWWRQRAGHRPDVDVATRLLGSLEAAALAAALGDVRALTGTEPGLTSSAWEAVTAHRHQVLVCRGPRCTALGSDATAEALVLALMACDLGDDDVLVTHTGCQLPCNQAPLMTVQPDDVWYGGVDPAAARRIVDEHLVGGTPVEEHRLPR
ncbi:(2Fe-2S) ferredoxin domain-containing protein [Nocardioides psychrotolerans]|uniref:(2Fe-2S) ferredoxin domain-containing protein n=1 Tax=Nocardioides psychrotolerans TaxID=1005945 RepID=UPI003137D930